MNEDPELLRRFAEKGDEDAFRVIVERHVNLVHSIALRQVNGDAHLAADVTQVVFTDLARKARSLVAHPVLAGWLFTSTRYTAAKLVRGEQRRRIREQEAHMSEELTGNDDTAPDWSRVRPVLDDALADLNPTDREAILLRFFEARDFNAIGARLNVAQNTARMRVERALDKLRIALERRGVRSSSVALSAALTTGAVAAAPVGLSATVASAALAGAGGASWAAALFSMSKFQIIVSGIAAAAGVAGIAAQAKSNAALRAELDGLLQQNQAIAAVRDENQRLQATAAEVATLRQDDRELAALRDEAANLKRTLNARAPQKNTMQIVDGSSLDQLPKLTTPGRPAYPFEMRRAGVSGEVTIDFIIDTNGVVRNAHAASSTSREFEAAAVQAVQQSLFSTGRKAGRLVNTHMQMTVGFDATTGETTITAPEPVPAEAAVKLTWF